MALWKGKTRGGVSGYSIFIFIIKYTGLFVAYFLLVFVALYYWLFIPRKHLMYYYRKRLEYSYCSSLLHVYRMYYRFGQVLIDKIATLSGSYKKFTFNFDGEDYLRQMTGGGMLIGAHMGNWEIASQLLKGRLPVKTNILMFDEEHQRIKDVLDQVMVDKSFRIIPIKQDMSHIYALNQVVKDKELIVMHGDRYVEGSKTREFEFLGKKALFPLGAFLIALKFKLPVTFVFAMKETARHYHFYATAPKVYENKDKSRDELLNELMRDYIKELESKVRKYPNQFFNFYDFWGVDKEKNISNPSAKK